MADPNPDLRISLTRLKERDRAYRLARRYYEGDQDLTFIAPKYRDAFGAALQGMRYNRCATIVDVHADKLQLTGFIDEASDNQDIATAAREIWRRNRMDRRAGEVHSEAFLMGDAYCIVWPDDKGQAVIYPQLADRCIVRYGEDGLSIDLALKIWKLLDGTWRANLYYRDRVEKYSSQGRSTNVPYSGGTWNQFTDEDATWPLPYPWGEGMPFFHFANKGRTGQGGTSELHDVIPLQDAINKSLCNMLVAGEFAATPQRYAIGITFEKDEDGQYINPFKAGAGELWWMGPGDSDSGQVSFGQFAAGDVTQFTLEQESLDKKISNVSRVPAHWLGMGGTFTSGEQLKTAETPFTAKILDRQITFGNDWEDVAAFCLFVESGQALGSLQIATQWQSAEPRSDQEFWTIAQLKQAAGVPQEQLWREAGYDDGQIAVWLADAQAKADQAAAMGEALRLAMNDQAPPANG